jgi:hypothetical protein
MSTNERSTQTAIPPARIEAAMRHLDQRAEGGRCGEMVAEMIAAADAVGYPKEVARLTAALMTILAFPEKAKEIARKALSGARVHD